MRVMRVWISVMAVLSGTAVHASVLSGVVTNPDRCVGVQALLRHGEGVRYPCLPRIYTGAYDKATGRFRIEGLPPGIYDLRLVMTDGHVDGVDMRLTDDTKEPFTEDDERAIRDFIANYPDSFNDIHRPVLLRGNGRQAKVLVECIRARQFHSGNPGEIIWRVEVWRFEKHTGAWVRSRRGAETVARLRVVPDGGADELQISADRFRGLVWLFSPDLGGFEVGPDQTLEGLAVAVPEVSIANGKVPGSVESQIEEYHRAHPQPYLE